MTLPPSGGGPAEAAAAPVEPLTAQSPAEGDEGGTARYGNIDIRRARP